MLDRDNVGLIVLLQHQPTNLMSGMDQAANPALKLCVATTHLLYNPKVDNLFIKPSYVFSVFNFFFMYDNGLFKQ